MEFQYQDRTFTYVIERRQMKSIRARVKTDGIIHVSAPHRVPEAVIRNFLIQNAGSLQKLLDELAAQQASAPDYTDGSAIPFLGKPLTLSLQQRPCPTVLEGDVLRLYAKTSADARIAVRQWMIGQCTALYRLLNRETWEKFRNAGYDVPLARIEIKEMTSRWGSCTAASGRISMNFRLMQYPVECIRGVFCHEYAHFLHQDHSKAFYEVLLQICPDYRESDAMLRQCTMR